MPRFHSGLSLRAIAGKQSRGQDNGANPSGDFPAGALRGACSPGSREVRLQLPVIAEASITRGADSLWRGRLRRQSIKITVDLPP